MSNFDENGCLVGDFKFRQICYQHHCFRYPIVTSCCVCRSVMSANKFYRTQRNDWYVPFCPLFRYVRKEFLSFRCDPMRTKRNDWYVPLCPPFCYVRKEFLSFYVSACEHNGKTAVSRYVHVGVEPFHSTIFYYIHIYRNYFQLTLCEWKIIK